MRHACVALTVDRHDAALRVTDQWLPSPLTAVETPTQVFHLTLIGRVPVETN